MLFRRTGLHLLTLFSEEGGQTTEDVSSKNGVCPVFLLYRRVLEHRSKTIEGFTNKYNCTIIVYYEFYEKITDAIRREKQLKNWKREWKLQLIKEKNPELQDLWEEIENGY